MCLRIMAMRRYAILRQRETDKSKLAPDEHKWLIGLEREAGVITDDD